MSVPIVDVWENSKRGLNFSLVLSLMDLDVADRSDNVVHDGHFYGADLVKLGERADKYSKANAKKNALLEQAIYAGIIRLINATRGIADYAKNLSRAGQRSAKILEMAMFESMAAMFDGREPQIQKLAGFNRKFIDAEFLYYFAEIFAGNSNECARWSDSWRSLLAGCHIDMFINDENCEFN